MGYPFQHSGEKGENGFLDLVYEAALDADLWPVILERFSDMIGGNSAALMWQNQITGAGTSFTARTDPALTEQFFGHYARINPLRRSAEFVRRAILDWKPQIILDEDQMPKEAFVKTEFYNDFFRVFDVHSTVTLGLALRGVEGGTVDVMRSRRSGPFSADDLSLCANLQPHLVRAFRLGQKFAATRSLGATMAEVVDHSPYGLFVLDADGRVRHVNRTGEALIAARQGLTVIRGRLTAGSPEATRRLDGLIAAAALGDGEQRSGGSMALTAPNRRLPLSIMVSPVRSERLSVFGSGPAVVVCVTDLEAGISVPDQRLRDLFGLSAAEARVALALFEGLDPRQAAERLGVSFYTVRGHLVRIFDKTHTHGQVQLARLMMRTIGVGMD
jgi:DNA-binding CsgD family transcriptional regulator/PAS domain-containing protein